MLTPCPSCSGICERMWQALSVAFRWMMSFVALINGLREQILWTLGFSCQYQTSHFDWTCSKCSCKIPQNFGPKSGLEISGIGSTLDILLFFREMPHVPSFIFEWKCHLFLVHVLTKDLFYHANIYSYIGSYEFSSQKVPQLVKICFTMQTYIHIFIYMQLYIAREPQVGIWNECLVKSFRAFIL
jgi:hypothetical protein